MWRRLGPNGGSARCSRSARRCRPTRGSGSPRATGRRGRAGMTGSACPWSRHGRRATSAGCWCGAAAPTPTTGRPTWPSRRSARPGHAGAGGGAALDGRGGLRAGQGRGGARPVRGAQLDRLVAPHDAGPVRPGACSPSCAGTWPRAPRRVGRAKGALQQAASRGPTSGRRGSLASFRQQRRAQQGRWPRPSTPHRGLRSPRRADPADRPRGASAAVGRGLARLPLGRAGLGVVRLAPPPPGGSPTLPLPTTRHHLLITTTVVLVRRSSKAV